MFKCKKLSFVFNAVLLIYLAAPRFDIPESYNDGLIFRHEEVMRLKIPLVAKPTPRVSIMPNIILEYNRNSS